MGGQTLAQHLRSGAAAGAGVGLRNTRERLAQLYGDRAALALRAAEGGGTEAEVRLPLRTAEAARG